MTTSSSPAAVDIAALKRQMLQLQELHASGTISGDAYEEGRFRLERRILDWVLSNPAAETAFSAPSTTKAAGGTEPATVTAQPSRRLLFALAGVVLVVAVAGYSLMGTGALMGSGASGTVAGELPAGESAGAGGKPHATNFDQIAAMTEKLAAKLQDKPDDAEGWAMLARSYSVLGRNPEAIKAYDKALALRPEDAMLLADYADALAVKNNHSLAGEPLKIVEKALKIDGKNLKALSLAGTHAFEKKDYASAVKFWSQVVQFGAESNPLVEQVKPSLAEARDLAGLPPDTKLTTPPVPAPAPAGTGKTVSGVVTLAPSLTQDAKPEDTVFIFARAAQGAAMPVAILRKQVKDLPIKFTLDDSMAMSPSAVLSGAGIVTVGARISKSGNAMPQKGDLAGQSGSVTVGSSNLAIEIKDIFKP